MSQEEKIPLPKFSEFADKPDVMDGEKVKIESIIGHEITIIGFRLRKSRYKDGESTYLTVQFKDMEGERKVFFTGSTVLIEQFEQYGDRVPFLATVRRVDKYFTLS